jgi:DNA-binding MarR family transcriptional regulator
VPGPTDTRARLVRIAARGGRVLPVAAAAVAEVEAEVEAEWARHLGARRMQQLRDALTRLAEIADP